MNAKTILNENIVIDAHLDLATHIELERSRGNDDCITRTYYDEEIQRGALNFIVSAVGFGSPEFLPELAVRKALRQIAFMKQEIEMMGGRYCLCTNFADMQLALKNGQVGIILMMEGCDALVNDITLLDTYHDLGIRIISLAWSRRNFLATGAALAPESRENHHGLSNFGIEVLERIGELGMILDISHLNDAGFTDAMQAYHGPVIATHSACRSLSNLLRNNSGEQLHEIGKRGGVIGANMVNFIVDMAKKEHATVADYVRHIKHIRDVAGPEAVGFGFDFCNKLIPFINERGLDELIPSGKSDIVDGYNYIDEVVEEMVNQGFTQQEVIGVIGGNFFNFFEKHLR